MITIFIIIIIIAFIIIIIIIIIIINIPIKSAVVIAECLVAAISYLWEKGRTPRNRRSTFKNELVVNTFGIFLVCVLENLLPQKNLRPPGYKYFYQQSKILPHSSRCHFEYWLWCTGKFKLNCKFIWDHWVFISLESGYFHVEVGTTLCCLV